MNSVYRAVSFASTASKGNGIDNNKEEEHSYPV